MKILLTLLALVAVTWALPTKQELSGQQMVDFINNQEAGTWKAKLYPRFSKMSTEELKGLMGAKSRDENPRKHLFKVETESTDSGDDIPDYFDAREKWPSCADVISTIPDQSSCGSCWAVASASVMSDRVCIGTNGTSKIPVSALDLMSCCSACGYGCNGGYPDEAFYKWTRDGIVSGSGYSRAKGCEPYPFPECEHHVNKTKYQQCPSKIYKTPKCKKSCQVTYKEHEYKDDKIFGKSAVYLSQNVQKIQTEIMTNGPVGFAFMVYADFPSYSSGVYQHKTGGLLGGHAVRAIGWGVEDGTPYWLIANSWNEDWGDKGYFKILRGSNHCGIENEITAALYKH